MNPLVSHFTANTSFSRGAALGSAVPQPQPRRHLPAGPAAAGAGRHLRAAGRSARGSRGAGVGAVRGRGLGGNLVP